MNFAETHDPFSGHAFMFRLRGGNGVTSCHLVQGEALHLYHADAFGWRLGYNLTATITASPLQMILRILGFVGFFSYLNFCWCFLFAYQNRSKTGKSDCKHKIPCHLLKVGISFLTARREGRMIACFISKEWEPAGRFLQGSSSTSLTSLDAPMAA